MRLSSAVVKATAAVYAAKAKADAEPTNPDLKFVLTTARKEEREAVRQLDGHVKVHGCKVLAAGERQSPTPLPSPKPPPG